MLIKDAYEKVMARPSFAGDMNQYIDGSVRKFLLNFIDH